MALFETYKDRMKRITIIILGLLTFQGISQEFTGLRIEQLTKERLDFNILDEVSLVSGNDTLIHWNVDRENNRYTKTTSNRIEEIRDFKDSLVYTIINYDHDGWKWQEKIVRDASSRVIVKEITSRYEYHLTRYGQEVIYDYFNNPSKEYWLKGWKYKSGNTLTESTEEEGISYDKNEMSLEDHILYTDNQLMKDRKQKFYNPLNLCVFVHKACTPVERTEVYEDPKGGLTDLVGDEPLVYENYLFTTKAGRINDIIEINGREIFNELKGFLIEAKGSSSLLLKYSNDDFQEIPVELVIPFEVNTHYE